MVATAVVIMMATMSLVPIIAPIIAIAVIGVIRAAIIAPSTIAATVISAAVRRRAGSQKDRRKT
jgi:hypothetical protein